MKINKDKILEMAYETYKRMIAEDVEQEQVSSYSPIDIHPYKKGENYFMYVSFTNNEQFGEMGNIAQDLAADYIRNGFNDQQKARWAQVPKEKKIEYFKGLISKFSQKFRVRTDNGRFDGSQKEVDVSVTISNPLDIMNEDGSVNEHSVDVQNLRRLIKWVQEKIGMDANIAEGELDRTIKTMYRFVSKSVTQEYMKGVDGETEQLFLKICKEIGQKETLEALQRIKVLDNGVIVDHEFSPKNKLRFLAQAEKYDRDNPSANQVATISYLATERQWAAMGRQINDDSYPYFGVTRNAGRTSKDDSLNVLSGRGVHVPTMSNGKYSPQQLRAMTVDTNAEVNSGRPISYSYNSPYYDVSATVAINGAEDAFSQMYGMSNNMSGEMNNVAMKDLGGDNAQNAEDIQKRTDDLNKSFGTEDYSQVDMTYDSVLSAATSDGVYIKKDLNADASPKEKIQSATEMIREMLLKRVQKDGRIFRDDNYNPIINTGVILVMSQIGLPMDSAPAVDRFDDAAYKALYRPVYAIINKILVSKKALRNSQKAISSNDNSAVNEMLDILSPLFIFEETFNKNLNILREHVEK